MKKKGLRIRAWGLGGLLATGLVINLTLPGFAGEQSNNEGHALRISVRVYDYAEIKPRLLFEAEEVAGRVYDKIGVAVRWMNCRNTTTPADADPACLQPLGSTEFALRIFPRFEAASAAFRRTVGFAVLPPGGGRGSMASVFYPRVAELAEMGGASRAVVLGHALAHEIGHLLLGTNSHSQAGLMRAEWLREDLRRAAMGSLVFTPEQGEVIRAGVLARTGAQRAAQTSDLGSPQ